MCLHRRREEQSAKLRKTAEKLLLNQLKKHALGKLSTAQQRAVLQAQQSTAAEDDDDIPADLRVSHALKRPYSVPLAYAKNAPLAVSSMYHPILSMRRLLLGMWLLRFSKHILSNSSGNHLKASLWTLSTQINRHQQLQMRCWQHSCRTRMRMR